MARLHIINQAGHLAHRFRPGVIAAVLVAFAAGWTTAGTLYATRINTGLVQAFHSVGQNVFGEAVFGAVAVPPNPVLPQGAIQMDIAIGSQIPAFLGVFAPVDPCRRFAQMEVQGGTVTIAVDYQALPDGFVAEFVEKSLADRPLAVTHCAAPPTVDGSQFQ